MNKNYFDQVQNIEQLKTEYKKLALLNHPDHGGITEIMQSINMQYALLVERFARAINPDISEEELIDLKNVNEVIRKKVEAISHLPNINIEICGSWVWVSGQTRDVKSELKENGFRWASKKKEWYFPTTQTRSRGRWKKKDIQNFYGSKKVEIKKEPALI